MKSFMMWCYIILGILSGLAATQLMTLESLWQTDDSSLADDNDVGMRGEMDTASLTIISHVESKLIVMMQSTMCWKCPLKRNGNVRPTRNTSLTIDTRFPLRIELRNKTQQSVCSLTHHFRESGLYILDVRRVTHEVIHDDTEDKPISSANCSLTILNNPLDSNLPVYVTLAGLVFLWLLWIIMKCVYRRLCCPPQLGGPNTAAGCTSCVNCCTLLSGLTSWQQIESEDEPAAGYSSSAGPMNVGPSTTGPSAAESRSSSRVMSVDTLRGISLTLMIFVNYGGGEYWYFKHAAWDGLTVADLVFPWFVFVMGVSIAMSYRSAIRRGSGRLTLLCKTLRRFVILFLIGLSLSNRSHNGVEVKLSELRILGVLQRLAITFFVVGLLETACSKVVPERLINTRRSCIRDLLPYWPTWLFFFCLTTLHISLTFLLPVPGCPRGYLGPGGLHHNGDYANCTGGAAGYIDRIILTPNHMYKAGSYRKVYDTDVAYDPEGLLGTLTSIILCILGLQAGRILINFQDWFKMSRRWIVWSLALGLIAGTLCDFEQFGGWVPINKNLWSLSYILALSSMAFLLLAVLYVIIDVYHWWDGAPFVYVGMNSILIYVGHELLEDYFPLQFNIGETSSHWSHLITDVWGSVFWIIIAALLYRSKVFIAI